MADRFEIKLRTVYRDVRALMEAGVPIGSEAGKGYFIVDGYHLPRDVQPGGGQCYFCSPGIGRKR